MDATARAICLGTVRSRPASEAGSLLELSAAVSAHRRRIAGNPRISPDGDTVTLRGGAKNPARHASDSERHPV